MKLDLSSFARPVTVSEADTALRADPAMPPLAPLAMPKQVLEADSRLARLSPLRRLAGRATGTGH